MYRYACWLTLWLGLVTSGFGQSYPLKVCSFNIQFLGQSKVRKNAELVNLVKDQDVVVVQELVAPPYPGVFPDGQPFRPDPEARSFFDQMKQRGFSYWLSEEDTGPGRKNQLNTSATEWFVAFYKPASVRPAGDLPSGFLAADRTANPDFDRVPYAFAFRTPDARMDFVLISAHLRPSAGLKNKRRRGHELASIAAWTKSHSQKERDFFILGDLNLESATELAENIPAGYRSLNQACRPTNTNKSGPKPYDHILYQPAFTEGEIDQAFGFRVVDLIEAMRATWKLNARKYPGGPIYDHNKFRQYYSDHHPVEIRLQPLPQGDDD